jgi:hypothetical protein
MDEDKYRMREKIMIKLFSSAREQLHTQNEPKVVTMTALQQSMKLLSAFGATLDEEELSDQLSSVRLSLLV